MWMWTDSTASTCQVNEANFFNGSTKTAALSRDVHDINVIDLSVSCKSHINPSVNDQYALQMLRLVTECVVTPSKRSNCYSLDVREFEYCGVFVAQFGA